MAQYDKMKVSELGDISVTDLIYSVHIAMLRARIRAIASLLVTYPESSAQYQSLLLETNVLSRTSEEIDKDRMGELPSDRTP